MTATVPTNVECLVLPRDEEVSVPPAEEFLHPRDFAADCPKAPMPPHRRFKSYVGLSATRGKLQALLSEYRFDTCEAVLARAPGVGAGGGAA